MADKKKLIILCSGEIVSERLTQFFLALCNKNDWPITFSQHVPKHKDFFLDGSDLFILIPANLSQLKSSLTCFVDARLFRPWIYSLLIYQFYSPRCHIAAITDPVGCKVFNHQELQRMEDHVTWVARELVQYQN